MRGKICLIVAIFMSLSCSKYTTDVDEGNGRDRLQNLSHEMIVLGKRLENPYKTENMSKALASLYPSKAGLIAVSPTDLYVRFLPKLRSLYQQYAQIQWTDDKTITALRMIGM